MRAIVAAERAERLAAADDLAVGARAQADVLRSEEAVLDANVG